MAKYVYILIAFNTLARNKPHCCKTFILSNALVAYGVGTRHQF